MFKISCAFKTNNFYRCEDVNFWWILSLVISLETYLFVATAVHLHYTTKVPSVKFVLRFFFPLHQHFLTVQAWGSAGPTAVRKLCECQQGGVWRFFVMRCWDKGSIHYVSHYRSPTGLHTPVDLELWSHSLCVGWQEQRWWIALYCLFPLCKAGAGTVRVWSVSPCSSHPLICYHSPALEASFCVFSCLQAVSSVDMLSQIAFQR